MTPSMYMLDYSLRADPNRRDEFIANVRAGGGDCSVHYVPRDTPWPWWNVVWSGDEIYDWMFSKTAPAEVR